MQLPSYGRSERKPNHFDIIRDAITARQADVLRGYVVTHRDLIIEIARDSDRIDPVEILELCPELTDSVVEALIEHSKNERPSCRQQPEVILKLASLPGVAKDNIWSLFVESCEAYSDSYILEGLDTWDPVKIEAFVLDKSVSTAKLMLDLSKHYKGYDKVMWSEKVVGLGDFDAADGFIESGAIEIGFIDDAAFKLASSPVDPNLDPDDQTDNWGFLTYLCKIYGDKIQVDRVEDLVIASNNDALCDKFMKIYPTRTAIEDHILAKTIMKS